MKTKSIIIFSVIVLCSGSLQATEVTSSIDTSGSKSGQDPAMITAQPQTNNVQQSSASSDTLASLPPEGIDPLNPEQFPLQLLQTRKYHAEETQAKSGEQWVGLFITPEGFQLLPTTITVNTVYDPVLDPNPTQITGKEVLTDQPHKAVFLVKGATDLEPGSVPTVFHGWTHLMPSQPSNRDAIGLSLGTSDRPIYDNLYNISFKKISQAGKTLFALAIFDSGPRISQHIQLFERCCDMTHPSLVWAGDLDRDGKLDFLIDATNHYNVSRPMLFLSSHAKEGKLVKPVAELRSVGC